MEPHDAPILIVLCGPNGAGKSTFYEIMLKSHGLPFVNADLMAAGNGFRGALGFVEEPDAEAVRPVWRRCS